MNAQLQVDHVDYKQGQYQINEKSFPEEKPVDNASILKFASISLKLLLAVIGITIIILIIPITESKFHHNEINEIEEEFPNPREFPYYQIYTKSEWGGVPAISQKNVTSKIRLVVIKHVGAGPVCETFETCSQKLRTIQDANMAKGFPDIYFSFFIGGDGNIYVGRGFNVQPEFKEDTIDIVFSGNMNIAKPTTRMEDAAISLLKDGVEILKLDPDYVLVAHNQTANTMSPGINLYKQITQWPHYSERLYFHNDMTRRQKTITRRKKHLLEMTIPYPKLVLIIILCFIPFLLNAESINETLRKDFLIPYEFQGYPYHVFQKVAWGGVPAESFREFRGSVKLVVFKHLRGYKRCKDFNKCSLWLQNIQRKNMAKGMPDIFFNFFIGGEGNVYMGRGWKFHSQYKNDTIDIVFCGDFDIIEPTTKMLHSTALLLRDGVEIYTLDLNYVLVAHNQTANTKSPGENLFKRMKTWPHYSRKLYFGNKLP